MRDLKVVSNDEVDVLQMALLLLGLAKKYMLLLIVMLVAGIASGYIWYLMATPVYKDIMACNVPTLRKNELMVVLSNFNHSEVKDLSLVDNLSESPSYSIEAKITNLQNRAQIQAEIVSFINANEFVARSTNQERAAMEAALKEVISQEEKINALITASEQNKNQALKEGSLGELFKAKLQFMGEHAKLENRLKYFSGVTVIQGLKGENLKPLNKNIIKIMAISVALAFTLASLLITAFEFGNFLKRHEVVASV
jgi:hypothetical protein